MLPSCLRSYIVVVLQNLYTSAFANFKYCRILIGCHFVSALNKICDTNAYTQKRCGAHVNVTCVEGLVEL